MVFTEIFKECPDSDIDRFLTHLDLCLKNQKSILMTLLDERPRSILSTHEVLYPGLTDDQCYINLKGVLRRFYQRSIPDAQVRESFWNRSQGPDEPAHQYAADLKVFAEKAFPEMQAKDREMMIRRQFVAALRNIEAGFKIMFKNHRFPNGGTAEMVPRNR